MKDRPVDKAAIKYKLSKGIILPPETDVMMTPYKDPLEPVDEGFGYKGCLAQNKDRTHVQCHICGYFFAKLGAHIAQQHGMPVMEYREKFQLMRSTRLSSEMERLKSTSRALKRTKREKKVLLKNLAEGRKHAIGTPKNNKWTLEKLNKHGRCYYQLLDKLEKLAKKNGGKISQRKFLMVYGPGDFSRLKKTFGSWNNAVVMAGIKKNHAGSSNPKWTRDDVIEAVRVFTEIEGRPPRVSDMQSDNRLPSTVVLPRLFNGSIVEMRKAANLAEFDYLNERGEVEEALAEKM